MEESVHLNYTIVLSINCSDAAVVLVIRFLRTGGPEMLRAMKNSSHHEPDHSEHTHHA
jgi:uncharacterized protein